MLFAAERSVTAFAETCRREEFVYREINSFKQLAGIIFACCDAFLLGNTEIVRRYKQLNISLKLDDGEHTKCYEYALPVATEDEVIVEDTAYFAWDCAEISVFIPMALLVAYVNYLCRECDWIYYFIKRPFLGKIKGDRLILTSGGIR